MLPFLKNKEATVQSNAEDEALMRKPDDGEPYEALDAIVDDMAAALPGANKKLLKSALESLCEYIRQEDQEQDEQTF
jgi:hypothetical protein